MKYFAVSDCHGFYSNLMFALKNAGFDISNPEHALIVCGDLFDRGSQPKEIFDFVKSLPKDRSSPCRPAHGALPCWRQIYRNRSS